MRLLRQVEGCAFIQSLPNEGPSFPAHFAHPVPWPTASNALFAGPELESETHSIWFDFVERHRSAHWPWLFSKQIVPNAKCFVQDKLWLAPELLRRLEYGAGSELLLPTVQQLQMADIFDLGLVLCEMVNGKACWDEVGRGSDSPAERRHSRGQFISPSDSAFPSLLQETVNLLRKNIGLSKFCRPFAEAVSSRRGQRCRPKLKASIREWWGNAAFAHSHKFFSITQLLLIRDCWKEDPNERPKIELVRNVVRQMRVGTGSSRNVMDHVFGMLEQYAERLESEVDERTKELAEEKLKADTLLSRLLPRCVFGAMIPNESHNQREVANRLKLGESVAPEHFDSATVFFSDLCSFTAIAARLSPLGVVHLVNQLFTTFDAIIEEHDIYKVETIGLALLWYCFLHSQHLRGWLFVRVGIAAP